MQEQSQEGHMSAIKIWPAGVGALAILAIAAWFSFCAGVYWTTRGNLLNQAHLELGDARLEVTILDAVQASDFQRSNDILRQRSEFAIFQHDYLLRVAGDLTFWTYALHPNDTFDAVFFEVSDVHPLSDAEIANLRARIGTWSNGKKQ
jgi:hypothetical protein